MTETSLTLVALQTSETFPVLERTTSLQVRKSHPINVPSQLGIKHKANKHKVGDRPIPTFTDPQLEILTELRQVVSTLASAQTRLFHEASEIMNLVNMIMGSYANSGIAPATHTLHILEERMIALHNEICSVRAEEDYYRDLEREIFAQIGQ